MGNEDRLGHLPDPLVVAELVEHDPIDRQDGIALGGDVDGGEEGGFEQQGGGVALAGDIGGRPRPQRAAPDEDGLVARGGPIEGREGIFEDAGLADGAGGGGEAAIVEGEEAIAIGDELLVALVLGAEAARIALEIENQGHAGRGAWYQPLMTPSPEGMATSLASESVVPERAVMSPVASYCSARWLTYM